MKQAKVISGSLGLVGILMITIALVLQGNINLTKKFAIDTKTIDVSSMATSTNVVLNKKNAVTKEEVSEVEMIEAPQSIFVPERIEVFEGLTIEELSAKLDRNLGNGYIAGKGNLIATKCLELGIDPYVAVAIMLHETGCRYNCSRLTTTCNNVGGQKGAPGCNGGSYKAYATLDEGIVGYIENLYRNYYSRGLTTVATIGPRYAASTTWVSKINWYVDQVRAS